MLKLYSSSFNHEEFIPTKYTCLGSNISPPLFIKNIPPKSKSLVLIIEDAEAKSPGWIHWLVFNIPSGTDFIPEGEIPYQAVEGLANNNTFGYEGPCPKFFSGIHHYHFILFALDRFLTADKHSTINDLQSDIDKYLLGKAILIGLARGNLT